MEAEFIRWLQQQLPADGHRPLGLGDDAAVLPAPGDKRWVVTTDLLCDGVHFELETTAPSWIGRKALAVNLSDLAAMGSTPQAAFVSLLLPRSATPQLAKQLYAGLMNLACEFDVSLAGGDTNRWAGQLVINVTALGTLSDRGPLRRGGALVGDVVLVTGVLGGSRLEHHLTFQPRVKESLLLHHRYELHAGMDLSDGLALDLSRLLTESNVGAVIETASIPISDAARTLSRTTGRTALQHALSDGEDFELLLTMSPDEAERLLQDQPLSVPVSRIGQIIDGPGQWQVDAHGNRSILAPDGYLHD